MNNSNWRQVLVGGDTLLKDTIERMDASGLQVALVGDGGGKLIGVVTDGDIRRALLRGVTMESPTSAVMNPQPKTLRAGVGREAILAFMRLHVVRQVPLLDDQGRIVELALLDELVGARDLPNWVVLMAGGLGTRLRPLTENMPKPMLPVAGRPILETIVLSLAEQGFRRIFMAINYKAEMIQRHFGNGRQWGVSIEYLQEKTKLGTVGALSLLPEKPHAPVLVMNGDLLTHANLANLLDFHQDHHAAATMAVREYDFRIPYGVVDLNGIAIAGIQEKPLQRFFVSAGIYALSPAALDLIPADRAFDMPALFGRLIEEGMTTSAYHLREYWLDIGRLEEFERAQREWMHLSDADSDPDLN
jgi:dTDP-glucose pyrophosphorylase